MKEKIKSPLGEVYRYHIVSTEHSSHKFGNCEVCHLPVAEVFHQTEEREYKPGYWTFVLDLFGHEECLRKIRKLSIPEVINISPFIRSEIFKD